MYTVYSIHFMYKIWNKNYLHFKSEIFRSKKIIDEMDHLVGISSFQNIISSSSRLVDEMDEMHLVDEIMTDEIKISNTDVKYV